MNIAFIGGGNMASALIGGLLKQSFDPATLRVAVRTPDSRDKIQERFGIGASLSIHEAAATSDVIVIAVKPQQIADVAHALQPLLGTRLVVSVAAGIRTADLSRWLGGYRRVVRAMPNTPALVMAGISGLYAMEGVDPEGRRQAETILSAVGSTIWLDREELMDGVTAVSGSGPAYVFYFIEALARAANQLGLDAAQARQFSLETFSGAVKLALETGEDVGTLRTRVTSKGGTTERALATLEARSVGQHIVEAVQDAARRSRELGDEFGKVD